MLDELTKIVLKKFIETDKSYSCIEMALALNISEVEQIETSFNTLLEIECIKIKYQNLSYTNYSLTNKGRTYFKTRKSEQFQKYWFPIITSVISYLLGLLTDILLLLIK